MKQPTVYILANKKSGTLYVGVTSDLRQRVWQHKHDVLRGFSSRYSLHRLVYYELFGEMRLAIQREKQLKHWRRAWKIQLIENVNPDWLDKWDEVSGG